MGAWLLREAGSSEQPKPNPYILNPKPYTLYVQKEAGGGEQKHSLQSLQQKSKERFNAVRALALAVRGKDTRACIPKSTKCSGVV